MNKGVFLGRAILARLVSTKAGVDIPTATKVLDAFEKVVSAQLGSGLSVRMLGGYLRIVKTAASRRRNIRNPAELVDVPASEKIVFRKTRGSDA